MAQKHCKTIILASSRAGWLIDAGDGVCNVEDLIEFKMFTFISKILCQ